MAKSKVFWIDHSWPGRLAIMPRPRGGDWLQDEVRNWRENGLDVIVSLLTFDENADFDLSGEAEACGAVGITFLTFPIVDRESPRSRKAATDLFRKLELALQEGSNVGLHCRQGIGRSALVAASLLVRAGLTPQVAFERVSAARGCPVPETDQQRNWVSANACDPASPLTRK